MALLLAAAAAAGWSLLEKGTTSLLLLANALLLLLLPALRTALVEVPPAVSCALFAFAGSLLATAGAAAAAAATPTPAGSLTACSLLLPFILSAVVRPAKSRYCLVSSSELLGVHCSGSCCCDSEQHSEDDDSSAASTADTWLSALLVLLLASSSLLLPALAVLLRLLAVFPDAVLDVCRTAADGMSSMSGLAAAAAMVSVPGMLLAGFKAGCFTGCLVVGIAALAGCGCCSGRYAALAAGVSSTAPAPAAILPSTAAAAVPASVACC
jgi:hypothetical protein